MPLSLHTRIVGTVWLIVVGGTTVSLTAGWAERSSSPLAMWAFGLACMCCVLGAFGLVDLFVTALLRAGRRAPDPAIPVARAVHRKR